MQSVPRPSRVNLGIVNEEIPEGIPVVGIDINVLHTAPQTRLNTLRLPSEDVHDKRPTEAGKDWPCISLYHRFGLWGQSLRP